MSVAPSLSALRKRIDRFIWENVSNDSLILRQILLDVFSDFDDFVIFGGMVRDIARGGRSEFRSDVDLVIDAPSDRVDLLAQRLGARRNKYGGYRVRLLSWDIDFWALSRSWAGRYVQIDSFEDLVETTFFDWDSVAYHVRDRRLICSREYLSPIKHRVLDVCFVVNPSVRGSVLKAIERIVDWQVVPGFYLHNLLNNVIDEDLVVRVGARRLALREIGGIQELKDFIFNRREDCSQFEIFD